MTAATNDRYLKAALAWLLAIGLLGADTVAARSHVTRIDVSRDKIALVQIEGADASAFTIWGGPGTEVEAGAEDAAADIADWQGGSVAAPGGGPVYEVMFLCEACEPARKDSWRCYGVRYAPGRDGAPGLIQIPAPGDPAFPGNLKTIYRGVEGQWFRASAKWEQVVRARIQQALAARPVAAVARPASTRAAP
jgi:hypothetical protein